MYRSRSAAPPQPPSPKRGMEAGPGWVHAGASLHSPAVYQQSTVCRDAGCDPLPPDLVHIGSTFRVPDKTFTAVCGDVRNLGSSQTPMLTITIDARSIVAVANTYAQAGIAAPVAMRARSIGRATRHA